MIKWNDSFIHSLVLYKKHHFSPYIIVGVDNTVENATRAFNGEYFPVNGFL